MEELEQYHKRYFDTKYGEVALTCCALCGAVVWNPELHERAYHSDDNQGSAEEEGTGQGDGENPGDTGQVETGADGFADVGGEPVGVGRSTATDRSVSSPPAIRTGRATAAGTGRKGSR